MTLRWLHILLIVAFAGTAAIMVHIFFLHVGNAPYLATDDGLVNISYNLGRLGRYGFPAGPIQAGTHAIRTAGFFNFGPWYFLIGAAFTWLFGLGLEIQRAIHPLGIIAIAGLAFLTFRQVSLAAAGAMGALMFAIFVYSHWPMVRPDIMTATLAMAGIAAATAAINSRRPLWWFLAAAMTMGAITQHQIAGFTGIGLFLVWLSAAALDTRLDDAGPADNVPLWRATHHRRTFFAAAAGAILIGIIYAAFINFRFGDLWDHWTYYATYRSGTEEQGGYLNVLQIHFDVAFVSLPARLRFLLLAGVAAAIILLVLTPVMQQRRLTFALLAPPLIIGGAYFFSLGFYGNWHAGYAILAQTAAAWAGGAALAVIVALARRARFGHKGEALLALAVVTAFAWEGRIFLERPSPMQKAAASWVSIEDYVGSVLAPMPPRARVWGTFQFGYESNLRTDYVQLKEAILLVEKIRPAKRHTIAPDFIVIGYPEQSKWLAEMAEGSRTGNPLKLLAGFFPDSRFDLIRLIKAPPYGTTRIYRRVSNDAPRPAVPPSIRVNDGRSRQWTSRLLEPVNPAFKVTDGVSFSLPFGRQTLRATTKDGGARVGQLPAGVYLIKTEISRKSGSEGGFLTATPTNKVKGRQADTGFGFEIAPYNTGTGSVSLLVRHGGGALYISQFDADPSAGFRVTNVRPVEVMARKAEKQALPPFKKWSPAVPAAKITPRSSGIIGILGDASAVGYQILSPDIPVPAQTQVAVTLPAEVKTGSVGWGVLDQRGHWLLPPKANRRRATFNTGPSQRVKIVFANLGPKAQANRSEFDVFVGALEVGVSLGSRTYIDDLVRCHPSRQDQYPDLCLYSSAK
ncbi:MAG: hypothetical protein HQ512_11760 [Rhodospirillales bacterium]|nr:hypothetical protein [Rhodospirillales bacterium]